MTENEAIEEIMGWTCALLRMGSECTFETADAQEMAIKALEEIQQYRKIGTVEECREAVEKQKPKKPIDRFTGNEWTCECPVCRGITDMPYEVDVRCIQYCGWCGQRLDWEELT